MPDPVRLQWVDLPSRAAVRDIVCSGADVFVACADASLHRLGADGVQEIAAPASYAPSRIVAVRPDVIIRWGWEHLAAVGRADGALVWDIDMGHLFDEDEGDCSGAPPVVMLPNGMVYDLDRRAPVTWCDEVSYAHVALPDGFAWALGARLERVKRDGRRSAMRTFDAEIQAFLCAAPLLLVLDGGRVVREDGTLVGTLTLDARRSDTRARNYPAFPVWGSAGVRGNKVLVAMNDRELCYADSCLSGVAVMEEGAAGLRREYRGCCVVTPDEAFAAVPGGLVWLDDQGVAEVAVDGLQPCVACRVGAERLFGTLDGRVLRVHPADV